MRELEVTLPHGVSERDQATIQAAAQNDEGSRLALRGVLDRRPDLVAAIDVLRRDAEITVLDSHHGYNVLREESARVELKALRATLAAPHDSELERLLIECIALCWLELSGAETQRAQRWNRETELPTLEFWDRHVSRLNEDFLRACKALATTRRLLGPRIQVNIGANQVNMG